MKINLPKEKIKNKIIQSEKWFALLFFLFFLIAVTLYVYILFTREASNEVISQKKKEEEEIMLNITKEEISNTLSNFNIVTTGKVNIFE